MNHVEFHVALAKLAGDQCFATRCERTTYSTDTAATAEEFTCYVAEAGWTKACDSPEAALALMAERLLPENRRAGLESTIAALQAQLAELDKPAEGSVAP